MATFLFSYRVPRTPLAQVLSELDEFIELGKPQHVAAEART
jgi:hypothetical protein